MRVLVLCPLVAVLSSCSCDTAPLAPPDASPDVIPDVRPDDTEGEGEGDGEGEGEGESVARCVLVEVGADLPPALHTAIPALVDAATALPVVADGGSCAPALALSFGDAPRALALIESADVDALAPEGFIVRSGDLDGVPTLAARGRPSTTQRSPGGAAYGALAALEELGFAFLHPLEPSIPSSLPATLDTLEVTRAPRWPTRNIHLHTMHPLEHIELLNGWGEGGPDDEAGFDAMLPEWDLVLLWLIANGQNEVEWVLLEANSWSGFAMSDVRQQRLARLVERCHAHGIACGIDTPIVQEQQHTFRLVRELSDNDEENLAQIRARLAWLMAAGFDFLTTSSGTTEFTNPGAVRMLRLMDDVTRVMEDEHGREARIHIHVSHGQSAEPFIDEDTGGPLDFNQLPTEADPRLAIMPHTVQIYGLDDPAPTYGNTDFAYMREYLHQEVGRRRVLWHPESAYWVSVDVDVPLFLPIYAERRVADLMLLADDEDAGLMGRAEHAGKRMDGQSLFSSGWEWGYWLGDVASARASFEPRNGALTSRESLRAILRPLARALGPGGDDVVEIVLDVADDQRRTLIFGEVDGVRPDDVVRRNGFAYLAGREAFDDLSERAGSFGIPAPETQPRKLDLVEMRIPFHAPPRYTGELDALLEQMVDDLVDADARLQARAATMVRTPLLDEIVDALHITRLRAEQVKGLYDYVDLLGDDDPLPRTAALATARAALDEAALVVAAREAQYRVPADRVSTWRDNPTVYDFMYLWTVRTLYHWWRDEGLAVDGPRSPCYLNIMNPADVALGEGAVTSGAELLGAFLDDGPLAEVGGCLAPPALAPALPQNDLRARP